MPGRLVSWVMRMFENADRLALLRRALLDRLGHGSPEIRPRELLEMHNDQNLLAYRGRAGVARDV